MDKKWIVRIVIIAIIVLVSNIPIVSFFISLLFGDVGLYNRINLRSKLGGFSSEKAYYDHPDSAIKAFERYRAIHPEDSVLYRNSPMINPLKFWLWRVYLTEPLYRIPRR